MPQPEAAPVAAIQIARDRLVVDRARWNSVMAGRLDRKQTTPGTTTRSKSCCVVKQPKTRNIPTRAAYSRFVRLVTNIHFRLVNYRNKSDISDWEKTGKA